MYLVVFAVFTNLSTYTVENFGIPLLPILIFFMCATIFFNVITSQSYVLFSYRDNSTYLINYFCLIFLSFGLINADLNKSLSEVYYLLTGLTLFHLTLLFVQSRKEAEGILFTILLCGPIIVWQGGYQLIQDIVNATFDNKLRAAGWWADPNTYAFVLNFIYLTTFYFIEKKKLTFRLAAYLTQASCAFGVLISLSRGGILIFLLSTLLGWRTFWRSKIYLTFLVITPVLLYFLMFQNIFEFEIFKNIDLSRLFINSDSNREDITNGRLGAAVTGLLIYLKHPFFGVGFGNLLSYAEILSHIKLYTHNMFIEILAVSGPVPLLFYLFTLGYLKFRLRAVNMCEHFKSLLERSVILFIVTGFFSHYLLFMKPIWVFFALFPIYFQLAKKEGDKKHACSNDYM